MARDTQDIFDDLLAQVLADPILGPLYTSTSKVASYRQWLWLISEANNTEENLYDDLTALVNNAIATMKAHTLQWYVTKAKAFQYGDALPVDSDVYAVIDATKQVVAYAAAVEITKGIRIKVAKLSGGDLAKITTELAAFTAYMGLIKDAGVRLQIDSNDPDSLQLSLTIYYDPLILDSAGKRLDGTDDTPVQDAIDEFLKNLPFNGLYTNFALLNAISKVEGVVMPDLVYARATHGALPYTDIDPEYLPDAGYLRIDNPVTDLILTFQAHGPI
jgi:hypothetical protein